MDTILIGNHIMKCRQGLGLTQEQLAEKAGVSKSSVSKWENGRTIPDVLVLLKLSRIFGITINQILEPGTGAVQIKCFEELKHADSLHVMKALSGFTKEELAKAVMGTSPEIYEHIRVLFSDTDFEREIKNIGRVRLEEVEEIQKQIVNIINLT